MSGWTTPTAAIDSARAASESASKRVRGWAGLAPDEHDRHLAKLGLAHIVGRRQDRGQAPAPYP